LFSYSEEFDVDEKQMYSFSLLFFHGAKGREAQQEYASLRCLSLPLYHPPRTIGQGAVDKSAACFLCQIIDHAKRGAFALPIGASGDEQGLAGLQLYQMGAQQSVWAFAHYGDGLGFFRSQYFHGIWVLVFFKKAPGDLVIC